MTMDECPTCTAPIGSVEERQQLGLRPDYPVVCSKCSCIMKLDENLHVVEVPEAELEAYFEKFPYVETLRYDVLCENFTDGSACPGCGTPIRNISAARQGDDIQPGAFSVCGDCGAVTRFTFDMRLRLASDKERVAFICHPSLPPQIRAILLSKTGVETAARSCPRCFMPLTKVSQMGYGRPDTLPQPGDQSICDHCASLLVFTEDGGLRAASKEETTQAIEREPAIQAFMDQVLAAASRKNQS